MRIVVFGASGNCGGHFVRLAAAADHFVTAVTRRPLPVPPPSGVKVVLGDVLDEAFVRDVVTGHDAVMSGLGIRYKHPFAKLESPEDFTSRATANIVAAMKAHGVRRIGLISAAGVGDSRSGLNAAMRLMLKISKVGLAYADIERVEEILKGSELDWQAVRPTTLTHEPASGKVRVTDRYPMSANIPREDVAAFILRELEAERFSTRTPMITVR